LPMKTVTLLETRQAVRAAVVEIVEKQSNTRYTD